MTKVEALKQLYTALGGSEDISDKQTVTEVCNEILALAGGNEADTIADAIANIAEIVPSISPTPTPTPTPAPVLIEKIEDNILTPLFRDDMIYDPGADDADGYSLFTLKAPTAEETEAEWIRVEITANLSDKTVTINSTDEGLTHIMKTKQTNQPRFYLAVRTVI